MDFTHQIQRFSFKNNKLEFDETNGRVYGILITHQVDVGGQLVETGYQEAFVLSTPAVDLLRIDGVNLFKRFIKNNGGEWQEVDFDASSMPKYQEQPFIVDGRVLVSNRLICNAQGIGFPPEVAAEKSDPEQVLDKNGQPVLDGNGDPVMSPAEFLRDENGDYVPKPGYFLMANYHFDHAILQAIVMPVIGHLMYRLDNRD